MNLLATHMEEAATSNLRKYQSGNPVVQLLIRRFFQKLVQQMLELRPTTVIDLGCGEGVVADVLLKHLGQIKYIGYDKNPIAIREAERRSPAAVFQRADIFDVEPTPDAADVILCLEVLEHMEDADRFLKHIARLQPHRLIVSVPWEPFFRIGNFCRGQYLRRLGNHPEHVHCFGVRSLQSLLAHHFLDVRIERSFPWLFGICRASASRI
jgi:SAM-dependent methyltransferase